MVTKKSKILQATQTLAKVDYYSRPMVLKSLYKSCGEECLPLYQSALTDDNPQMQIAGAEILVELLAEGALNIIKPLLKDKNKRVQRKIKRLIKQIKQRRDISEKDLGDR